MNARCRTAWALTVAASAALGAAGCGPNTTNEDNIGATSSVVPQRSDMPNFKSEGEYQAWMAKEKAKNRAGKGKKAAAKADADAKPAEPKPPAADAKPAEPKPPAADAKKAP